MTAGGAATFVGDPKLGIPVRVFLFRTILGIPVAISSAAIVLETVLWLFIIGVVLILPVPHIWGSKYWTVSLSAISLMILSVLFLIAGNKIIDIIPKSFHRFKFAKISQFVADFIFGIKNINKIDTIKAILAFAVGWLVNAVSLWVILYEFGWRLNIQDLVYVGVFAYLVGTFSMLPMGLGSRDVTLVLLLTQLGPNSDIATATALIQRVFRTVVPLFIGLISINILGIGRFKQSIRPEGFKSMNDNTIPKS